MIGPKENLGDTKNSERKITSCCQRGGAPGALLNASHVLCVNELLMLFRLQLVIFEMVIIMTPNPPCNCSMDYVKSYM